MDIMKYLKRPDTYIAAAMIAAPIVGGLARVLAGGDFFEGAKQIMAPPNDDLYLAGSLTLVMFQLIYRQRQSSSVEQRANGDISK